MDALTRAGYLVHAESSAYSRRLTEASRIVADHPGYAVSTSWGKDSVAMLSVAADICPEIVIVHGRYRTAAEVFADVDQVRDCVLARSEMRHARYVETEIPGAWEIYERAGAAFVTPETPAQRAAIVWWRAQFEAAMDAAAAASGCRGVLIGMRATESRARRLNIATHGRSYTTRGGRATALPLAGWTGTDVWARIVSCGLPWLRIYDIAADRERARSDFCWAAGGNDKHLRDGTFLDWRAAYPEQVAAWTARWPELARLADCDVGAVA